MITLAPALAFSAALAPPAVAGTPDPLDMAVLYAASRFDEAALAFLSSANEKEALPAFQSMRACVGALSILPARSAAAIAAKRRVAGWRVKRGDMTLSLCAEDRAVLLAAIERDEGRVG